MKRLLVQLSYGGHWPWWERGCDADFLTGLFISAHLKIGFIEKERKAVLIRIIFVTPEYTVRWCIGLGPTLEAHEFIFPKCFYRWTLGWGFRGAVCRVEVSFPQQPAYSTRRTFLTFRGQGSGSMSDSLALGTTLHLAAPAFPRSQGAKWRTACGPTCQGWTKWRR